jgi:23S rRNA pseudouridine1911/1915/1917 synthase
MAIQRALAAGLVRRGERVLSKSDSVAAGDRLDGSWPETTPSALEANPIPLDVLFEDRHFLAVNKPPGMIVHPGAGTGSDTMVHALLAHCRGTLSGIGGIERPGIVHRLDRETSGAILVAKTDAAHRGLAEQFAARTVQKEYLALVGGRPQLLRGSIHLPIRRHPTQRHKMTASAEGGGREAWTDWELVEPLGTTASLLRCVLHTGRTHQIRVHLKSLGHPILGDRIYGGKGELGPATAIPRTMLHAARLAFRHPITGKALDVRAPLPADFQAVLKALRKR